MPASTPAAHASLSPSSTADRELVLTRLLDAPRALVFAAWTDARHIDQWWGPNGFTNRTHEMSVRPGGLWRFVMLAPNGVEYDNRIQYVEVSAPERLVYVHGRDIDDDPDSFHVTVTFDDDGSGRTRLTMRTVLRSVAALEEKKKFGAVELGHQTIDRFVAHLAELTPDERTTRVNPTQMVVTPGRQDVVTTREFDAPRALVFAAMTDPRHIPHWWGPRNRTTSVDTMDVRKGGIWRFVIDGAGAFNGVYHLVQAPERVVQTFEFEPIAGHVALESMTLDDVGEGRTRMTVHSVFTTVEDRDGIVASGMEQGASETYERMDELLVRLAAESR
jgi:uncharacterized protein YndB with AHSA1/START domain